MPKPTGQPFGQQQQTDGVDWLLKRLREHEENERHLAVELERMRIENRNLKQSYSITSKQKTELEREVIRLKEMVAQMHLKHQSDQRTNKSRGVEGGRRGVKRRRAERAQKQDKGAGG